MTVPIFLPADAEIGKPEVPAVNRAVPFASETEFLLRETHEGNAWLKYVVYGLLLFAMLTWIATFSVAVARISPRPSDAPETARVAPLAA